MKGTNEDLGKKILKESRLPIISADNMAQAAQRVVAAIGKKAAKKKVMQRKAVKGKAKQRMVKRKKK
jgi:succinyl-CoA synthetase beta subunit